MKNNMCELDTSQLRCRMQNGWNPDDYVIVPTMKSIQIKEIPIPFRVNHSSDDPTHELVWVADAKDYPDSHYVLEGKRELEPDTEITFDYNLKKNNEFMLVITNH